MLERFGRGDKKDSKVVVFCVPTLKKPYQPMLDSLAASVPLFDAAGWEHYIVNEIGCPYISAARASMLRKALDIHPDVIVFLDHDLGWYPPDLLRLVECEGDVVAGTYRFKREPEEYMCALMAGPHGKPHIREDGECLAAHSVPAGFLKITKHGVNKFMQEYPELCFGERFSPCVDLFNHGAWDHVWWGEDYAFSRRWREKCGPLWLIPDLQITHYGADGKAYRGNYHEYLGRLPGGALHKAAA